MTSSLAPARWSRLGAAALALAGLLIGLRATTALAASDSPQLRVDVAQRWALGNTLGAWTAYTVTVANLGGTSFTGEVQLVPADSRIVASNTFPVYVSPVTVGRGSQRTVVFDVIDAQNGYSADVRDPSGRLVGHGDPGTSPHNDAAVGILSDLTQAEQKISAPLHTLTQVNSSLSRFGSAQDFPTSAAYLSGLGVLVIDQFDSAALSQAQLQSLKDYVGLGGTLIEAGGPSWRRTLLSLPSELLPMRPSATSVASLSALDALIGRATDATAQIASGALVSGRVTLAADDGQPLVVEGAYGAGRVEELAFDPFADPFTTQVELAAAAWSHAIERALSGVQGAVRPGAGAGYGSTTSSSNLAGAAPPGAWAPGFTAGADQITSILSDIPAANAPPVGLLGGLLVAYVLLAGLLNYLFLKAAGRRQLMWLSVPVIALVFTIGAYGVGFGTRGSDFLVTEAQVQRLGPEGAVETYSFDGVFPPRKGDVTLALPANTLASTAVAATTPRGSGVSVVAGGNHPQVLLSNVAVWNMHMLQTLAVAHPYSYEPHGSAALDAQVRVQKGHLVGRVVNLSGRPIQDVQLIGPSGAPTMVSNSLAPGAAAAVDAAVTASQGAVPSAADAGLPLPGVSESTRASMVHLAATQVLGGGPGLYALVGFTGPADSFTVDGARPGRSAVAAVVVPVVPQGADSLSGLQPRPRVVSTYTNPDATTQTDVYDLDLPAGLTAPTALSYQLQSTGQTIVHSVEVYDWNQHSWRSLPAQTGGRGQPAVALASGEVAQGIVRVRAVESYPNNPANLAVVDQPSQ